MKKLMVLMMTGLLVGAWYTTFTSAVEKPMEYKKCLQQAQKNEEKGIYYDAILEYKKALEYDGDNRNIYMKIAEDYRNMGDDSGFVDACNSAISLDGDNEQAILTLADYYTTPQGAHAVRCQIIEKESTVLDLTLVAPGKEAAQAICRNWPKKSQEIYENLMGELI